MKQDLLVAVDCIIFGYEGEKLQLLVIKRDIEPFQGSWVIPGGFLQENENLEEAARRILYSKTSVYNAYLEQLFTFGEVNRDPRGRVISVAYFSLIKSTDYKLIAGITSNDIKWVDVKETPELGFDHKIIVNLALERLKGKFSYQPLGFNLLEDEFTLTELQQLYETVLNRNLDKRNFRKRILDTAILKETGKKRAGVKNRQPLLYTFDLNKYKELTKQGFEFKL